ncbi:MAG: CPBP family intramembrane metalloprotease [Pedobacter sp.]|nr:MAG: CPBP family intramembrane metalloprotease [Pedobacter sp.]
MNLIQRSRTENSAYVQLLILGGYALAGLLISSVLGLAIVAVMYGKDVLLNPAAFITGDPKYLNGLKIIQIMTSIGLFMAPAIALAWTEGKKLDQFYGFKKPQVLLLLSVFVIMAVSSPITELTGLMNQKMTLPGIFKPIEEWMRQKEDETMRMTIELLTVRSQWDFAVNMFMIALLPAIAEELMFRGGIQRSFSKMFGNHHVAIWVTAIIFSAIHVQFFGFVPRMLLGALFGYIYFWTKSLWYTMFAHFLNNGYAVCLALYLQKHNMPLDSADNTSNFSWIGYAISILLTIFALYYFKQQTSSHGKQLDQDLHE